MIAEQNGPNKTASELLTKSLGGSGTFEGKQVVIDTSKKLQAESFREKVIHTSVGDVKVTKNWEHVIAEELIGAVLGGAMLGPASGGISAIERTVVRQSLTPRGNYVYRGLAEGEDIVGGLVARAPNAGNTPISHVAGKRASQWISTTKSESIAVEQFGQHGVVRVDLNKVASQVVDVSGGFPEKPGMISNWAKKAQEVLIENEVPAEAIKRIR